MSTNTNTAETVAVVETETEHPCACQRVHVEGEDLRCYRTTKRTFAPGHDAKLKSRLIRAGFQGLAVHVVSADGTTARPSSVAEAAGAHGFGYQVAAGIVRLQREANEKNQRKAERDAVRAANAATREAAKAEREQAKLAKKAATEAESVPQVAKVGRWEFPGSVVADGSFAYVTKKGEAKLAKQGTYTLV